MKTFWKIFFGSILGCIVAFLVMGLLLFKMIGSVASMASPAVPAVPSNAIVKIDFTTQISERGGEDVSVPSPSLSSMGSFSLSQSMSLLNAVRAIEIAAEDPAIKFIYINPDKASLTISQAEELRNALARFREKGKAVVAYANNYTNGTYYLASVADKVIINPYGSGMINGLSTSPIFLKDLLDKFDVKMQLIRHGKYKAAGEQFTRNNMSEENREQNQVMISGMWSSLVEKIAESRDFSVEEFNNWVDNLDLSDAESLVAHGLVDDMMYQDEFTDYLCNLYGAKDIKDLKFVTLDKYAAAKLANPSKAKAKIAVVYANGEIVDEGNQDKEIVGSALATQIAKVRKDSTIKAVVLRVNSPGGSVLAAQTIKREMDLLCKEKPVIASYGDYAASGGYWISAGVQKIFTNKTTLTGSIGVFSLMPALGGAYRHFGVNYATVNSNKHSDALTGMDLLDNEEIAYMQKSIEHIYKSFTSLVAEGRGMSCEAVDEIGQGRVWTGRDALKNGLTDSEGGLIDAIRYAATSISLEDYKIVEYPKAKTTYEKMLAMISGGDEQDGSMVAIDGGNAVSTAIGEIARAYHFLTEVNGPVMMARIPYVYDIR